VSGSTDVARTTLRIGPFAALARAVSFVVPLVVARVHGAGPETDAFFWALSVPTFVYAIAGSVVGPATLPVVARLGRSHPGSVGGFVGGALALATVAAGVVAGLGVVLGPALVGGATRFGPLTAGLAVGQLLALAPMTVLVAVISVLRAGAESEGAFRVSVLAPLARGGTTLAVVLAAAGWLEAPVALPLAYGLGGVAEAIVLTGALWRTPARPAWPDTPAVAALRETFAVMAPLLVAEALLALAPTFDRAYASAAGTGAVSALEYADRARLIPRTFLDVTLVAVSLQVWSQARARGDVLGQRRAVATAVWWILLLVPPALAGMSIGRHVIVGLMYGGGRMDPEALRLTADALDGYLPGVLFGIVGIVLARAWVLEGRARALVGMAAGALAANALVGAWLAPLLGVRGAALGASAGALVEALVTALGLGAAVFGEVPRRAWGLAVVSVGISIGCAALARAHAPPVALTDLALWAYALVLVGALAWGARVARRGVGGEDDEPRR
jgi:putative peptidoglycan lipid II flippase